MKQDFSKKIAIQNQLIKALEHEGKIKDRLIQNQEKMIMELEKHNTELQKLIENMLTSQPE